MLSFTFGWEISPFVNGGANLVIPINKNITVVGYQIDIALGFQTPVSGFSQVLCTGNVVPSEPTFSGVQQYFIGPVNGNGDTTAATAVNPNNFTMNAGGAGWSGPLFAAILKTNAPDAMGRSICMPGLGITAAAGSFITFHMDGAGCPGDVEMQGVIFYKETSSS
jgi:hypothetical protein